MEELYTNYIELIKDSGTFNKILTVERKLRSPFIDAQTGIAQSDCQLWRLSSDRRCVGEREGGAIYRYPAFRWHKKRREYLLKNSNRPSCQQSDLANCSTNTLASTNHTDNPALAQHPPNQLFNSQSANNYGSTGLAKNGTAPFQVPSRADSTGSHSCITNDSDSRDLSTATSQSFDSPAHNMEDDSTAPANGTDSVLVNSLTSEADHPHEDHLSPPQYSELATNNSGKLYSIHGLNDQTKAAIRLHSFIQKKKKKQKDAGQSLMKSCNSILVKTTNSFGSKPSNQSTLEKNQQMFLSEKPEAINHQSSAPPKTDSFKATHIITPTNSTTNANRPFVCFICGQTYKTRPGLSYHFIHTHNTTLPKSLPNNRDKDRKRESSTKSSTKKKTYSNPNRDQETSNRLTRSQLSGRQEVVQLFSEDTEELQAFKELHSNSKLDAALTKDEILDSVATTATMKQANCKSEEKDHSENPTKTHQNPPKRKCPKQNPFCDFCLGTVERNRRTKLPEELISCSGCGSSGHPSCLRFSDNIKLSAQKYDWQCIECKTCSNCNNADNEDQLLFCDDCDRSYHTYCLKPPLNELPEGNWSCHLCIIEYHSELKQEC